MLLERVLRPLYGRHPGARPSTRWRLRKAVKAVDEALGSPGLLKHPGKTFIGRIERGFDFLGYHFGPDGLTVAAKTIERFVARAIRLYEQEPAAWASVPVALARWSRTDHRAKPLIRLASAA